jgi:hypothetical protein
VADEETFLSSGGTDYGAQLAVERFWKKYGFVGNFSYVVAGDFSEIPQFDAANPVGISAAFVRRFGQSWTGVLQFLSADSVFRDTTESTIAELESQISIGFRYRHRNMMFGFGITENVQNFDNTPDIAGHFMAGIFLRKKQK